MNWRSIPQRDFFLFARSYHSAAKKLVQTLDVDPGPIADFDLCPVLSMYRHTIELHLKGIVLGEGGNFLPDRPDKLSVHKTRSLSWLAQFVSQIVTVLKWEDEFQCDGVESLADFKAVIQEANVIDPAYGLYCPSNPEGPDTPPNILRPNVLEFLGRLDALLALLERTADALTAAWDLRSEDSEWPDGDFKPTIQ